MTLTARRIRRRYLKVGAKIVALKRCENKDVFAAIIENSRQTRFLVILKERDSDKDLRQTNLREEEAEERRPWLDSRRYLHAGAIGRVYWQEGNNKVHVEIDGMEWPLWVSLRVFEDSPRE